MLMLAWPLKSSQSIDWNAYVDEYEEAIDVWKEQKYLDHIQKEFSPAPDNGIDPTGNKKTRSMQGMTPTAINGEHDKYHSGKHLK